MTHRAAVSAALAGAATISFSAVFYAYADVSPVIGGLYRMVYAIPLLIVLAWVRRRADRRTWRERALALAAGVFLACDIFAWFATIEWLGVGLATLVVNAQVLIVPIATWMLFAERPTSVVLAATVPAMVGLGLISGLGGSDAYGARPLLGVTVGVGAAALYSAFLITFRRSNRRLAPTAGPVLDATIGAALTSLLAAWATGASLLPPSSSQGWLVALAIGPQAIGWLFIAYALPRLDAAMTSFAVILQPTLTLIWGRLLFDETPSPVQLLGVAVVWSTIALVVVRGQPAAIHRPAKA